MGVPRRNQGTCGGTCGGGPGSVRQVFRKRVGILGVSLAEGGFRLVYLDLVMGLNFLVDYLLLSASQRLSGFTGNRKRLLAAAAVGAVYSGGCCLPGFGFLAQLHWRIISLLLICAAAFGWDKAALRRGGIFLLLTMALGGLAMQLERGNSLTLLLAGGCLWMLTMAAFGGKVGGRSFLPLEISDGEQTICLTALVDSGNTLRDPVSGEEVLVIGPEEARCLTGLSKEQLSSPMDTLSRQGVPGLRLIPYRAVGGSGMLLAKRFSQVRLGNKSGSALVAFAPHHLGDGTYQALAGSE